jgi:hypothetical protein
VKDGLLRPPAKPEEPEVPEEADEPGDAGEPDGAAEPFALAEPFAPDEGDRRSPAPVPTALAAAAEPSPVLLVAGESALGKRANQLFVAAIACRTAWRPLSRTPFPGPAVSPCWSSSAFSVAFSPASAAEPAPAPAPAAAEPVPDGARKPAPGVFELFRLPISSAGNGTGAWPEDDAPDEGADDAPDEGADDAPDEGADDEGTGEEGAGEEGAGEEGAGDEDEEASVTAPSGAGSSPFLLPAALAADRDVPDADDADRDVSDRVRDEDMVPLSSVVLAVSASGSTSWPDGATNTDGSLARPAWSTPSSSVPKWCPFCTFGRDYLIVGE